MLEQIYFGNPLSAWIIFGFIIIGSVILGWLTQWAIMSLTSRSKFKIIQSFGQNLNRFALPIWIFFGLQIGINAINLSPTGADYANRSLAFGLSMIIMFLILRAYETLHNAVLMPMAEKTESQVDDHILGILRMAIRVLVISLGGLMAISNAGFDVGAALAGLGIGGLALALAAQDAVANFFGGITVIIEKPFKIGDLVEVSEIKGYVRDIGLRTTLIETTAGSMIRLPNKQFTDNAISLVTYTQTLFRIEHPMILRYDTTAEKMSEAMTILKDVIANDLETSLIECVFKEFGEYGFAIDFEYEINNWTEEQKEAFASPRAKGGIVRTRINFEIMQQFQKSQIKIALPIGEEIALDGPLRYQKGVF
jgi:MscS family membrane protein